MERRLGFIGIIIDDRHTSSTEVNAILSQYGDLIAARLGLPYRDRSCAVIALIVDATTDELGEFTGKLGMVKGITVKSAMSKK